MQYFYVHQFEIFYQLFLFHIYKLTSEKFSCVLFTHTHTHTHTLMCVCVCVCVWIIFGCIFYFYFFHYIYKYFVHNSAIHMHSWICVFKNQYKHIFMCVLYIVPIYIYIYIYTDIYIYIYIYMIILVWVKFRKIRLCQL